MIDFSRFVPTKFRRNDNQAQPAQDTRRVVTYCRQRQVYGFGHHIAVSWDDQGVKMATARHWGPWVRVIDVVREQIPAEMSDVDQLPGFVADRIAQYIRRQPRFIRRLSLVVSDRDTVFRSFVMPSLKRRDLESAIRFETQKQLPFPADRCHLGFRELWRIKDKKHSQVRVGLHAATALHVKTRLEPLLKQGLPLVGVYHAPESVGQLLRLIPRFDPEALYTVLELTPTRSMVAVYRGTCLEFVNAGTAGSAIISDQGLHPGRLESFADAVVADLQTSQDFFSGQTSQDFSTRVLLHGELPNIEELLGTLNGRSVFEFETFPIGRAALPSNSDQVDQVREIAVTCLPVLSSAMDQSTLTNLLPVDYKRANRERRLGHYAKTAAALLVVVLGIVSAIAFDRTGIAYRELQQVSTQLTVLKSSEANRTYHVIKRQIVADQAFLESAKEKPSVLALALKELTRITDPAIRLQGLQVKSAAGRPTIDLSGIVATNDLPPEIALAEFVEALRASPFFDRVEVVRHSKTTGRDGLELHFNLQMTGIIS
ncbi:MAG: pilus assembly protein PilM [bacterium]